MNRPRPSTELLEAGFAGAAGGGEGLALHLAIVLRGSLRGCLPETGRKQVEAGEWALFHDPGDPMEWRASVPEAVLRLDLPAARWSDAAIELPPRLTCLRCPRRNTGVFLRGRADGRIQRMTAELLGIGEPALAARLRRQAWKEELFALVLERPELQANPEEGECCAREVPVDRLEAVATDLAGSLDARHSIATLARRHFINECDLKRGFRRHFGTTVFGYLRQRRMERAEVLLAEGGRSVLEVAQTVGYTNPSHFARAFREAKGCNPGELVTAVRS